MDAGSSIALASLALTLAGTIAYVSIRFSRMETEITHLKAGREDFEEVKKIVYKIHAQNEVLLGLKTSPASL